MIFLISDTKRKELKGVVFEDINANVSSKDQAWEVNTFLIRYFSTEKAAIDWCSARGISTTIGVPHEGLDSAKLKDIELKPYQVGENDIVLAFSAQSAKQVLCDYCSWDSDDPFVVEDLSNRLDMKFQDEEGNFLCTLKTLIEQDQDHGERYLIGWE